MRFTTFSSIFALATLAQALAVPESTSKSAAIFARSNEYFCGCGFNMNPQDTDAAVEAVKSDIRGAADLGPGSSHHRRVGSVVAFVCNTSARGHAYTANVDEFSASLGGISGHCGQYIAGARVISRSDRTHDGFDGEFYYGYQRWEDGHPDDSDYFCQNASSSGSDHC